MATMAETTVTEGAERAQAMFGEAGERARSAFERSTKLFDDMLDFAKGNVEAAVASGRAAAKGVETLAQEAADYGRKSFETGSAVARSFAGAKSPSDFFQLGSSAGRDAFDGLVAQGSRLSETYVKVISDVVQPLSTRFTVAADKFKPQL